MQTSEKSRSPRLVVGAAIIAAALAAPAGAQVLNEANGHYYLQVESPSGINWEQARVAAESMSFNGMQGHLVTFTSESEMTWFADESNYSNFIRAMNEHWWIGGYRAEHNENAALGWAWVTGEDFTFANWSNGEPNNLRGQEDVLVFWTWDGVLGRWNDDPGDILAGGYVVEFTPHLVPTPGSAALAFAGVGLMARRRRHV